MKLYSVVEEHVRPSRTVVDTAHGKNSQLLTEPVALLPKREFFRHTVSIVMEDNSVWFERLYDTHADALFRHLLYRLGDRERAKELMQDVFMRAWHYRQQGKEITHEKAWLFRAAHNAFVNEIRTDRSMYSYEEMVETTGFDVVDERTRSDSGAEEYELMHYLAKLKEEQRTVLTMRYIDGLEVKEIARILEEKETTISMRIKRGLETLKRHYEETPHHE